MKSIYMIIALGAHMTCFGAAHVYEKVEKSSSRFTTVAMPCEIIIPNISTNPNSLCYLLCNLSGLNIADPNGLEQIEHAQEIRSLLLHSNKIKILRTAVFAAMPALTYIDLRNNDIIEVQADPFKGLSCLERILLSTKLKPEIIQKIQDEAAAASPGVEVEISSEDCSLFYASSAHLYNPIRI